MKKTWLAFNIILVSTLLIYTSCDDKEEEKEIKSSIIEGLSIDNYPKVDGSTSTAPLNTIIACKLLDIDYKWENDYSNLQYVHPQLSENNYDKIRQQIKSSQTHQSFLNLINKDADVILSARKLSADEKAHADAQGVSLIETPIALDAFIFILNSENPIKSLTAKQIQDIYTNEIINWKEVGGNDAEIKPYVRNANSGSQELMETLVMKDVDLTKFPVSEYELMAFTMTGAFEVVDHEKNAICYTVFYYKENIISETPVKSIAVNGIYPDKETIGNRSYPYVAEVYAVIRSDLDKSSMAYKIYEWLQTEAGKEAINESGYIAY